MLVKKLLCENPSTRIEDVYIQTCRTHAYYHITEVALLYDIPSYHMIGQTLQSMLVIIYIDTRSRAPSPHLDLCCDKKADKQKKHKTRWHRITQLTELIESVVIGFFTVMSVPVTPEKKREVTSSRARMSGTRRGVPGDCCRDAWTVLGRSGAEWRGGRPCKTGTVGGWASTGEEVVL